jgi:WD40 repeat protein
MYALNAEGIPNAQDITDRLVDNLFFSSDITRQQIMVRLALLSATVQRDPRYAGAIPNELRTDEVHCIWFASEGAVSAMVSKDASNALVVQAFDVETLKPSANAPSSGCPIPATPAGDSAPDVRFTAPAGWTFSEAAGQFELYGPGRTPHYTGKPAGGLSRLVVAPKAKRAAWINRQDSSVYVLDLESRNITSLAAGELPAVSLAFSPDGKILATGGTDGSVRLWWFDLPGAPSKSLPDVPLRGNDTVVELVFSPKGDRLVSQSADGTLVVWRILEKLAPRTAPEMPMAFAPGIRMATASNEKRQLTATMASAPTAPPKTYSPVSVSSIAMRRDGKTALAVTDPSHFEVVDLESGQPVRSPEVAGRLSGGALSDDGRLAAVITGKNSIGVFTLAGGKIAHQYDLTGNATIRCLAFTPTLIVAGEDHNVQSWRLKDREPDNKHARVTPVALSFAPDGKIGAFLNETNGIRFISSPEFWDGVSGTLQMPGHPRSIGFSADGKTFQVLMNDGHAFSWPIDVASMHESACSLLRSTPPPPDPDGKPGFADWCKQPAPK